MKRLLMATACLIGMTFVTTANADNFTISNFAGIGNFGSFTETDLGAQLGSTDTIRIDITMAPNVILDTGSHFPLTLSLDGTGRIDASTVAFGGGNTFTVESHLLPPLDQSTGYANDPFKYFQDAISADCGSGSSSGGCGSTLTFNIINFQGFNPATEMFNGNPIFAAVDIFLSGCSGTGPTGGGCTGVVGLAQVPGPIVGAGLPGLIMAAGGMLGLARRRRNKVVA
jgi:hypothetical protein